MMVGGKRSPGTTTAEIITLQSLSGRIAEMPSIQHTQMGDMNRTTIDTTPQRHPDTCRLYGMDLGQNMKEE